MPKEGLGDDGYFDGMVDVYGGDADFCCTLELEVLGGERMSCEGRGRAGR